MAFFVGPEPGWVPLTHGSRWYVVLMLCFLFGKNSETIMFFFHFVTRQVFVTFESDLSQARCLTHMSRGILDAPEEQHMYTNPDGESSSLKRKPPCILFGLGLGLGLVLLRLCY